MSKETKFTKGDWGIEVCDLPITESECYYILNDKGYSISDVFIEDDAHLIKTAPKLYDVLEVLISRGIELMSIDEIGDEEDSATVHSDFNDAVMLASKTLAEARGE